MNQLLQALHSISDAQAQASKTSKLTAYQQIAAAASSPERALGLWEEAVKATQMDGAGKENAQFRAWKEGEGELFKEREVQNAVHLHLEWLALTLQRSAGATVKDMLPSLLAYAKEASRPIRLGWPCPGGSTMKKDVPGAEHPSPRRRRKPQGRRGHPQDARLGPQSQSGSGSVVVQWLKLGDAVAVDKWEGNPGNLDGLYKNVIQVELRAEKDSRVFEYWDYKMKRGADIATKSKLSFEIDKFNTQKMPTILWNRTMEYTYLGQKNRAMTELFGIIKKYPTHPDVPDWIETLEGLAAPPPTDMPASLTTPNIPPPAPAPAPAPAVATPAPAEALPGASPSTLSLPGALPGQ